MSDQKLKKANRNTTEVNAIEELTERVYDLVNIPISTWAVAATLESMGIRDKDVPEDYGKEDIFELAEIVFKKIKEKHVDSGSERVIEHDPEEQKLRKTLKRFLKYYGEGFLLSMPMLSQVAAILIFEYALWAWFDFNIAQATSVAIGTILSFIVTGGFIQIIGRLISRFKGEDNYYLSRKVTWRIVKMAIPTIFGTAVLILVLNMVLPFYPQPMMWLSMGYMLLISHLILAAGILYANEQRLLILIGILLGTGIVIVMMDLLGAGIYLSQWLGIIICTTFLAGFIIFYYRFQIKSFKQELFNQSLPKPEVMYFNNYVYYLYGAGYFLFLFIDRILAWSAGSPPPPYLIWFVTPYELGMDWALITLIVTIAFLEYSVNAFSLDLMPVQKKYTLKKLNEFNRYFRKFYQKQVLILFVIGIPSIILAYYGVLSLRVFESEIPKIKDFFLNPMVFEIFWVASISYFLLIFGLLNGLFFFTLNRPRYVAYPMLLSVLVNFTVGFIMSRWIGLEFAVYGLLAGSICFALITGLIARKFFKNLDFYYYSAY